MKKKKLDKSPAPIEQTRAIVWPALKEHLRPEDHDTMRPIRLYFKQFTLKVIGND